jgi:hypothetical protein
MRMLRTVLVIAPMLAAGACVVVDPFGPWSPSGTYYVVSANGQGIPAVLVTRVGDGGFMARLTGGELRLRSDRSFRLDIDLLESDRVSDTYFTQGLSGTWEGSGDAVRLTYVDPDTDAWRSVWAYREHGDLEVTLPGIVYGINVRLVLDR